MKQYNIYKYSTINVTCEFLNSPTKKYEFCSKISIRQDNLMTNRKSINLEIKILIKATK